MFQHTHPPRERARERAAPVVGTLFAYAYDIISESYSKLPLAPSSSRDSIGNKSIAKINDFCTNQIKIKMGNVVC